MHNSIIGENIGYIYDPKSVIVSNERFSRITFGVGPRKIPIFE